MTDKEQKLINELLVNENRRKLEKAAKMHILYCIIAVVVIGFFFFMAKASDDIVLKVISPTTIVIGLIVTVGYWIEALRPDHDNKWYNKKKDELAIYIQQDLSFDEALEKLGLKPEENNKVTH